MNSYFSSQDAGQAAFGSWGYPGPIDSRELGPRMIGKGWGRVSRSPLSLLASSSVIAVEWLVSPRLLVYRSVYTLWRRTLRLTIKVLMAEHDEFQPLKVESPFTQSLNRAFSSMSYKFLQWSIYDRSSISARD